MRKHLGILVDRKRNLRIIKSMKTRDGIFVTVTTIALGAAVIGSYCPWPIQSLPCYLNSFGAEPPELPQTYSPTAMLNPTVVMSGSASASVSPSPSFEIPS